MMKDEDNADSATTSSSSDRLDRTIQNVRSCTGCLYHSSHRKDTGRNPLCVGVSRTEKQAYRVVGNHHPEFDELNDGKRLLQFKYACLGYSVYQPSTGTSSPQDGRIDLPACLGIEMQLLDPRKAAQAAPVAGEELPVQVQQTAPHEQEEVPPVIPRPAPANQRPGVIKGDEFATRFVRTAGLIAGAVGHNLSRVAGSLKTGLDDIFYPDRRRPK